MTGKISVSIEDLIGQLSEEEELGEGPLTLMIVCTKCHAAYSLNTEALSYAFLLQASLMEYIRHIQNSGCPQCVKKEFK